jgi:hypothetical protein
MADGCVHLLVLYKQQMKIRSSEVPVGATSSERKRQAVRPVHHVQNQTCRVTLQQARRAAVLDQPSKLRHHWLGLPRLSLNVTKYLFLCTVQ